MLAVAIYTGALSVGVTLDSEQYGQCARHCHETPSSRLSALSPHFAIYFQASCQLSEGTSTCPGLSVASQARKVPGTISCRRLVTYSTKDTTPPKDQRIANHCTEKVPKPNDASQIVESFL